MLRLNKQMSVRNKLHCFERHDELGVESSYYLSMSKETMDRKEQRSRRSLSRAPYNPRTLNIPATSFVDC